MKNEKKVLIKRDLLDIEPSALVSKLISQNTQDLKKRLDKIKQQKIELNKDERNSTNKKIKLTDTECYWQTLSVILSVIIDRIYQGFQYKSLPDKQLNESKLPKCVEVSKERVNEILSIISKAQNDGLTTNVDGRKITLDNAESLLKGITSKKWIEMSLKESTTILLMM